MSVYLYALTASGGVPLYSRTIGDAKQLAYPVVGSLNGVHMYGKSAEVQLVSSHSEQFNICWRSFHDSITLIIIAEKKLYNLLQLDRLLDLAYNCMIMVYGLEDLLVIKNVERFKRRIRVCYGILDYVLKLYSTQSFGDVAQSVDVLASRNAELFQNFLNAFTDAVSSPGCLLVHERFLVMTSEWSSLSATEQMLLGYLVSSLPRVHARDIPIYLPTANPNIPQRLVTFCLVPGIEVCLLCGPNQSLSKMEKYVEQFWQPSLENLKMVQTHITRNLPMDIPLDMNLLGFVLLNTKMSRCLSSHQPEEEDLSRRLGSLSSIDHRRKILRDFIASTRESYPSFRELEPPGQADGQVTSVVETYTCSDLYKTYAINQPPYQLYVLFYVKIPTYAMSSVSKKLLVTLIKEQFV